jgi:hypothetical protein
MRLGNDDVPDKRIVHAVIGMSVNISGVSDAAPVDVRVTAFQIVGQAAR